MHATALICDEQQNFTLEKVTLPDPDADQVVIRSHATGVSIGTEFALIRNKISWGPYPICTGYQGTGTVEAVGAAVEGLAVGDRVYFRGNDAMALADGRSVTCASGAHCSHIVSRMKTLHSPARLAPGVGLDVASLYVMPAVGLAGVDMANPRMGGTVVVHGVGLIGLGVVAACSHRGCVIAAVDLNGKQLDLAAAFGARYCINSATQSMAEEIGRVFPEGADTVFECTGLPQCVSPAVELCRPYGTFIWQGNYGAAPVSFNFLPAHGRRLRMLFPCDDGYQPCRDAVIRNMALGALKWEQTITHRIEYPEAPAMFSRINQGVDKDIVGVVIRWAD